MTMMLALALVALFASIVVVAFLLAWHPTRDHAGDGPAGVDPDSVLDWCEHVLSDVGDSPVVMCPNVPTHELVGDITVHKGGAGQSAVIAAYCAEHAPEGAVRVRMLAR